MIEMQGPPADYVRSVIANIELLTLEKANMKPDDSSLRFGKVHLNVSEISKQLLCEKMVEFNNTFGSSENWRTRAGSDAHNKLVEGSTTISASETIQKAFTQSGVRMSNIPLIAKHEGVIIKGESEFVIIKNGIVLLVVDWKFAQSRSTLDARPHELFQARLYCLLFV